MKTLDDYLASSSSDDEDYPSMHAQKLDKTVIPRPASQTLASPTSGPRGQSPMPGSPSDFASTRRFAQEELREKMKKYLGEDAVAKSVEVAAASVTSPTSYLSPNAATNTARSTASGSNYEFQQANGGPPQPSPPTTATSSPPGGAHPNMGYEPVEVMLVDRGTQTVCSVEVQTDPLPPPPVVGAGGLMEGAYRLGGPGGSSSGVWYGNAPGVDYLSPKSRPVQYGMDGRPYRHMVDDLEVNFSAGANYLRSQLSVLQSNIDMLIARYNLPPPPEF